MHATTRVSPQELQKTGGAGPGRTALSVLLGAGFTLSLFLGIAHVQNIVPVTAPPDIDTLRAVSLPVVPPPPRVVPTDTEPAATNVLGFDATPSDSPVKITVAPPELVDLEPPPTVAPAAVIQVGQLYTDLRPRMNFSGEAQRIFQTSEVDQAPKVLYTVMPAVSQRMLGKNASARVTVILIIDANGVVVSARLAQSSGNPDLDAIMLDNIKEWAFAPAVKKGKRVKCLIQQGYNIRMPSASPFTI